MSSQPVSTPTQAAPGTPAGNVAPGAIAAGNVAAEGFIRIESITKRFGDFVAVDNVSLDIRRGEIFCLLGGSGCGKTTLLRMLAGFERPSAGRILIDGEDMSTIAPYERPVNMMFQSYALFPHMTVARNVAFGLEQEGLARAVIERRVAEMLEIVRMSPYAGRRPHQLSGGQRQRVALARALVKRPKLLLLDEPLAALDRKLREHTQFELLNIQKALGITFVVVTHDQQEAMTLATRMGVMERGRIEQVGTPAQVYETPATRFVADFIGSVNLFAGVAREAPPGCVHVESEELGGRALIETDTRCAAGARVWLAMRPEKISVSREPPAASGGEGAAQSQNAVPGQVREIAYMGDMSVYLVALGSGREVRVTVPNLGRRAAAPIERGEQVWLSWHPSGALVLSG